MPVVNPLNFGGHGKTAKNEVGQLIQKRYPFDAIVAIPPEGLLRTFKNK